MKPSDIETLRAYADCDMSRSKAARQLYLSPNTIIYRFDMIKKETGLNPRKFHDLVKLLSMIDKEESDEKADGEN